MTFSANAPGTSALLNALGTRLAPALEGIAEIAAPLLESSLALSVAPELAVVVGTVAAGELLYYAWTQTQTDQITQKAQQNYCRANPNVIMCATQVQWQYHIAYDNGVVDSGTVWSADNNGYPIGSIIEPGKIGTFYLPGIGYRDSCNPIITKPDGSTVEAQPLRPGTDSLGSGITGITFTHDVPDELSFKNWDAGDKQKALATLIPDNWKSSVAALQPGGTLKPDSELPRSLILSGDPTSSNPAEQKPKLVPSTIASLPSGGIAIKDLPDTPVIPKSDTSTTPATGGGTVPTTTTSPDNTIPLPSSIGGDEPIPNTGTTTNTGTGTTTVSPSGTSSTTTTYNPDGSISIRSTGAVGDGTLRTVQTTFNPDGTITQTQDPPLTSTLPGTSTGTIPQATTNPLAPATQGDISRVMDKLGQIGAGVAIGAGVMLPQLTRIEAKIPTSSAIKSAAKVGSCEASKPGGCSGGLPDQLKGLGDNLADKFNAATQVGQGAILGSIKNGVDLLNTKVGDLPLVGGMMGWMDSFEQWSQSSRVLEVIAAVSAVHNGIMLSQNFTFLLEQAITDIINIPHLILDPHGEAFNFHKALGKTIDAWGISIFGKETWALDKKEFQALNRIYQSATNAMYGIQQLFYDQMQMTEQIRTVLGKLGNAHLNNGNLDPDDFNPQPDPPPSHSKFLGNLEKFNNGLQDATNFIMEVDMIAQSIIQAEQIAQQLVKDTKEIGENIDKIEEAEKKKREDELNKMHLPTIGKDAAD